MKILNKKAIESHKKWILNLDEGKQLDLYHIRIEEDMFLNEEIHSSNFTSVHFNHIKTEQTNLSGAYFFNCTFSNITFFNTTFRKLSFTIASFLIVFSNFVI